MVTGLQDEIKKLETYQNVSYPLLSAYLEVPKDKNKDCEQMLKIFNKLVKRNLTRREKNRLIDDIDYIGAYIQQYRNTHGYKGIAIFSGGNKLWEVVNTQFKLPNLLFSGHSPNLEPLLDHLAEYERYLVVLADREKARIFTIYNGQIESETTIQDPSVPQKVRANEEKYYGRYDKISRHIQDHLHRHLKLIAEGVQQFVGHKRINGVIVGGHNELIHKTEEYLPEPLKKKIVAEFISELNTSLTELATKSLSIIQQINKGMYGTSHLKGSILNAP